MPPKRKATAAAQVSQAATTSANPNPSENKSKPVKRVTRQNSNQTQLNTTTSAAGRGIQPSLPLQMTTRAASRRAVSTSNSTSTSGSDSRRNSAQDTSQPVGSTDIDSNRAAKRTRLSPEPDEDDDQNDQKNGGPSINNAKNDAASDPTSHDSQKSSQDPSDSALSSPRKRKRSTDDDAQPSIEVTAPASDHDNGLAPSTQPEAQNDSNNDHDGTQEPPPKRRGRKPKSSQPVASAAASAGTTPVPDGSPIDGASTQNPNSLAPTNGRPKRLPGRRRAPNPNNEIEAALRRQLQLRTSYRAVAKALKSILVELSDRTINEIEDDPLAHQRAAEYDNVMKCLDQRLEDRLASIEKENNIRVNNANHKYAEERARREDLYKNQVRDLRENHIIKLKYDFMRAYRGEPLQAASGHVTDYEGDLIARPAGVDYRMEHEHGPVPDNFALDGGPFPERFDSRSRWFIDVETEWDKFEKRFETRQLVKEARAAAREDKTTTEPGKRYQHPMGLDGANDDDEDAGIFATYDANRRMFARAKLQLNALVRAADAVEEEAARPHPVIANENAAGLQFLADLLEATGPIPTTQQPVSQLPAPAGRVYPSEQAPVQVEQTPINGLPPHSAEHHVAPQTPARDTGHTKIKTEPPPTERARSYSQAHRISDILNKDDTDSVFSPSSSRRLAPAPPPASRPPATPSIHHLLNPNTPPQGPEQTSNIAQGVSDRSTTHGGPSLPRIAPRDVTAAQYEQPPQTPSGSHHQRTQSYQRTTPTAIPLAPPRIQNPNISQEPSRRYSSSAIAPPPGLPERDERLFFQTPQQQTVREMNPIHHRPWLAPAPPKGSEHPQAPGQEQQAPTPAPGPPLPPQMPTPAQASAQPTFAVAAPPPPQQQPPPAQMMAHFNPEGPRTPYGEPPQPHQVPPVQFHPQQHYHVAGYPAQFPPGMPVHPLLHYLYHGQPQVPLQQPPQQLYQFVPQHPGQPGQPQHFVPQPPPGQQYQYVNYQPQPVVVAGPGQPAQFHHFQPYQMQAAVGGQFGGQPILPANPQAAQQQAPAFAQFPAFGGVQGHGRSSSDGSRRRRRSGGKKGGK